MVDVRVSILMTVYNGQATIRHVLESLVKQEFDQEYEIVVVDDGSIDETPDLLSELSEHYPQLRVIRPGRVGRAKALNIGLAACRAPYVAMNDADDLAFPTRIRNQAEFLDDHPDVVLVAGWARLVDDDGNIIGERRLENDDGLLRRRLAVGNPFIHSTVTYRKRALHQIGGFNESLTAAIDYDAIERLARVGRLACLQEHVTTHYRGKRQYFRSQLGPAARWRPAARVAVRAAVHHAWWLLPVSMLIYAITWMPISKKVVTALHALHAKLVSR